MDSLIPVTIFFVERNIKKTPTNKHVFQMKIIINRLS